MSSTSNQPNSLKGKSQTICAKIAKILMEFGASEDFFEIIPWPCLYPEYNATSTPSCLKHSIVQRLREALQREGIIPMSLDSHDWFCWICHQSIDLKSIDCQRCTKCHLFFHFECAHRQDVFNTKPYVVAGLVNDDNSNEEKRKIIPLECNTKDDSICSECKHREADIAFNTNFGFLEPSREDVHKSAIELFSFAIQSLIVNCGTFVGINYDNTPMDKLIHSNAKLNLIAMQNKTRNGLYRSTEEFMFDIKLIIHNHKVAYFASQLQDNKDEVEQNCNQLEKAARVEMDLLEMCDGCYWNYNYFYRSIEQNKVGKSSHKYDDNLHFMKACGNPHGLIWVRMYNVNEVVYQPAKAFSYRCPGEYEFCQDEVWVIPFGCTTFCPKPAKVIDCWLYSQKPPPDSLPASVLAAKFPEEYKLLEKARKLARTYIANCGQSSSCKKYQFEVDYRIPKYAKPFALDQLYMDVSL